MSKLATIMFREDNDVFYRQDLGGHRGIPADVMFEIDKITEQGVWLRGPSHGGKPYGNGAILVTFGHNSQ